MNKIPGSLKNQGKRVFFYIYLFIFIFYIIYSLLRYKKLHRALAMVKAKPTKLTTYTCITPSWEKAKPLKAREYPHPYITKDESHGPLMRYVLG